MLRNVTCLLIQDDKNYYLTPYTDEREEDGKIHFSLTNSLTAITIWPHKDEMNAVNDLIKQLCLKFLELKHLEYQSDVRETSTVESLLDQLDETQKEFVNAVVAQFNQADNKKWVHEGRNFSTDIIAINLKNITPPQEFSSVDKNLVDKIAFQHACLEMLKTSVGWPAMKTLNADPNHGEILKAQNIFHPFALQLNNTVNSRKDDADEFTSENVQRFKTKYAALQESPTLFHQAVSDHEINDLYKPIKNELEEKLLKHSSIEFNERIEKW